MEWWPDRVPLRLRMFFRGAFLLLALATLGLAISVLREEKQLSYRSYREVFRKNVDEIAARLRHPTGQLALLNPAAGGAAVTPLTPLVLPFSALDFDDKSKAQQAAEMAGCLVQYPDHAQLCVSIGNNPAAGGFVYAVGAFASGPLVEHAPGELDLALAHRLRIEVSLRGRRYRWLAPLEATTMRRGTAIRGRLTGFAENADGSLARRPDRDFRGWLWQDGRCLDDGAPAPDPCRKRSFYSVRLPVDLFREEIYASERIVWPPPDLGEVRVRVLVLAPGEGQVLFDSNRAGAAAPFALRDLAARLLPGEQLRIRRLTRGDAIDVLTLASQEAPADKPSRLLGRVIRSLPVAGYDAPLEERRVIATPLGDYEMRVTGDVGSVDRSLGLIAGRLSWFGGAMLGAILLTWLAIEVRIIRRITLLTRRAAAVTKSVHAAEGLVSHDLRDLRGRDELGLLAGVLSDLLQRINEDVKREQIRAEQEKDMWHAVGHEIRSPLQSLLALHPAADDPSHRYIDRMQRAVRVLYGAGPPSAAIQSATVQVSTLDVGAFLRHVADNAAHAGIDGVEYAGPAEPVVVRADEHPLEDVITHVLSNATRYRSPGSAIRLGLARTDTAAEIRIYNDGPPIDERLIERIFEYGVTDTADNGTPGSRGQGLFVARTYMAKMGGTISARNAGPGVEFLLRLALA